MTRPLSFQTTRFSWGDLNFEKMKDHQTFVSWEAKLPTFCFRDEQNQRTWKKYQVLTQFWKIELLQI